jgi:hypothetical protein
MMGVDSGFTGLVLGLSRADVEWVVQARMVPARIVAFSPLSTLVLGLSREKTLKRSDLSIHHASRWAPILLAAWALAAVAFFTVVASFLRPGLTVYRFALVLLTILLAILAIIVTGLAAQRLPRSVALNARGESSGDGLPWLPDIPLDFAGAAPEIALVVLVIAFFLVLGAFVLFLVWLPVVFLVISLVTFGAWWRIHRAVFVMTRDGRPADLKAVGEDLLGRGAILSRTWDGYLEGPTRRVVADRRRLYGLGRQFFLLFGVASLGLAGVLVAERFFPSEGWMYTIVPLAGAGALFFTALLASVYRLRFR